MDELTRRDWERGLFADVDAATAAQSRSATTKNPCPVTRHVTYREVAR